MSRGDVCDVCGLPDPYNGDGDGIGSCECEHGDCGAPDRSVLCTCPTEDDGPACWDLGGHRYTIWNPLTTEQAL